VRDAVLPALQINVVVTDPVETRAALRAAAELSADLSADIDLVVPQVVPFPLSLRSPSVPPGFLLRQLRELASSAAVDPGIRVYLCRDRAETLLEVLAPHSLVIIGGSKRKRWFRADSERLARTLRKNGHQVILAGSPES